MLVRKLQARHLNMIALGGSLGTGIFLASGSALHIAGAGGAIAAYALIAVMVYFLITSLGEMATYRPSSGSFCEYSSLYVHPAFGFAMSYNYWFNWAITIAAELAAATIIVKYWFPTVSADLIFGLFFTLILAVNIFSVRAYGESEYILSFIKVAMIIVFIILSCLLAVHSPLHDWHNLTVADGPFHNKWMGFLSVFLIAGFSFQGSELIGVSAGETKDPKKNIPKAMRAVFWRLLLFYVLTTLFIGLLIPFNDPSLASDSSVNSSPFTIVLQEYLGRGIAANLVNAVVLIAVVSAANASLYASTRTLWHMGNTGLAPKLFSKTTKQGVPIYALLLTAFAGAVMYLLSLLGAGGIFNILVNISSLCGFIAWFGIALCHYCFRKYHYKDSLDKLSYRAKLFPTAPIISMIFIVLIVIGQGVTVEGPMTLEVFLVQYGALLVFLLLIGGYQLFTRLGTKAA